MSDVIQKLRKLGHVVEIDSIPLSKEVSLTVDGKFMSFQEIKRLVAEDAATERAAPYAAADIDF
ncbi:MAG: hypothetical protein JO051_07995 [Acidobacteriaceae bacterium]|nr:hypothetical protein [Acidobacteriaceae bacterium]